MCDFLKWAKTSAQMKLYNFISVLTTERQEAMHVYYNTKNGIIFMAKHLLVDVSESILVRGSFHLESPISRESV